MLARAIPFLIAGMVFYGSATPVSKIVSANVPVYVGVASRLLIAGLVLLPFAIRWDTHLFRHSRKDWLIILGVGVIGNLGFSFFMLYGMQLISGVMGSVIMSLTPALTAVAAVLFLNESLNARKIAALTLGVAGVLVMHLYSGSNNTDSSNALWFGSLLVFAAICCEAAYTLLGKVGSDRMKPITLTTLSALLSGILLLPWLIWQWPVQALTGLSVTNWTAILWWGVGTMALGTLCWYSGIKEVPGHIAASFMAIMPVSALVLSYILLGEAFRWIHLLGFGLAFTGVLLMIREHRKQAKQSASS